MKYPSPPRDDRARYDEETETLKIAAWIFLGFLVLVGAVWLLVRAVTE